MMKGNRREMGGERAREKKRRFERRRRKNEEKNISRECSRSRSRKKETMIFFTSFLNQAQWLLAFLLNVLVRVVTFDFLLWAWYELLFLLNSILILFYFEFRYLCAMHSYINLNQKIDARTEFRIDDDDDDEKMLFLMNFFCRAKSSNFSE